MVSISKLKLHEKVWCILILKCISHAIHSRISWNIKEGKIEINVIQHYNSSARYICIYEYFTWVSWYSYQNRIMFTFRLWWLYRKYKNIKTYLMIIHTYIHTYLCFCVVGVVSVCKCVCKHSVSNISELINTDVYTS